MNTTSHIDVNIGLNLVMAGQAPTNAGMVTFPAGASLRIPVTEINNKPQVRAHRLLYADLTIAGANASYQITVNNTTPDGDNPVGDPVNSCAGRFAYIHTNAAATLTGALPFTGALIANTPYLIAGVFDILGSDIADDGDIIARLVWTVSSLTSLGTTNFYCDILLAS